RPRRSFSRLGAAGGVRIPQGFARAGAGLCAEGAGMSGFSHVPVLRDEAVRMLAPASGKIYLDGTFGGGGYARAILESADCRLIAVDRDPAAVARGREL